MIAVLAMGCPGPSNEQDSGVVDAAPNGVALMITPMIANFGDVGLGSSSEPLVLTVTNRGATGSGMLRTSIEGLNPTSFSVASSTCTASLAAGATCTVGVRFTPQARGGLNASFTVTDGVATSVAQLQGNGAVGLSLTPTPHSFGATDTGQDSTPQTFTLRNDGTATTGMLSAMLTGPDAIQFVLGMDTCTGMTLSTGASCTMEVTHRPTAAAMHTAALTLTVSPGGSVSAALSATGRTPAGLEITPATQDFGSIRVGMLSATVSFMVRNPGATATPVLSTAITGANGSEFAIVSSTCTGVAVAGGGSCMVLARFAPDSTGDKTATLEVTGGTLTGSASLTAIGASGDLVATPSVQDFGSIAIGAPSASEDITITNMGAARSGTLGVTITGTNPGDFAITNDRCAGNTLMPSATCTISVQFTPAMGGARAARLRVSGTPGGIATAALTGTGVAPAMLTATPAMSDFGSVALGSSSSDVVVTIENTGGAATSTPLLSISGANADEFTLVSDDCMAPLLATETCTATLRFEPTSAGMKTATLDVTGMPGGTATTMLAGTAITAAALAAMPTALNFASFPETMTTSALSVSISNGGMASTGALALALSGADMGEFAIMSDACTGMVLAEAESCVVSIVFAPTSQGAKTASLNVSGMPGGMLNVALSGVGTPDIEIAPNPHDYGAIPVAMSADQIFVITNRTTTLRTFSTNVLGGADAAQFSFQAVAGSPPACTATTDLAAAPSPGGLGGQCRLTVRFAPTGFAGTRAASLSVTTTLGGAETAPINANAAGPVRIIGYRTVAGAAPACPVSGTVGLTTTSPVAFGNRTLGVTSPDIQVCVRNVSAAVSGILTTLPTYSGDMRIIADTCNGTNLATGAVATAQCSVVYRFFPRAEGAASSTLALRYGGNVVSTTVTGNGIAGPSIRVTGTADFGAVIATQTSERTFTVTNTGSLPTAAIVFSITTPGLSTRYTAVTGPGAGTCSSGVTTLAGGMSCTIVVRFAPVQADVERTALTRTLRVQQATQIADTLLTGTSLSMLTVTPTTRTYTAPVGDTSVTEMYRVDNLGSVPATLTIAFTTPANFLLAPTCTSVAAGASCTFGVYFRAIAAGPVNSNANISFGAYAANPSARATITMTGTGLPSPRLVITPTPRAFGSAVVGSMTDTSTFTVTNTGGSRSLAITISVSTLPLDYTVVRNGCAGGLDAGASCTVDVRFNPTVSGARNGNLRAFAGTAEGNAMLTGTGVTASSFTITPGPYDFGSGPAGTAIGPVTFTATNNAAVAAAGTSVVITGADAARFLVTANTCTGSIAAGATCTFNLTFSSPLAGPHRLSLVAAEVRTTTAAVATGVASVSGTSLGPTTIDLTPNGPVALGTVAVGRTLSTVFTLTNTGGVTSAIPSLAVTGAAASEYAIRASTCTAPLVGGTSCTFTLDLTPTSTGAKAAIVTATAGALSDSSAVSGTAVLEAVLSMTPGGAQTCVDHASGTATNCVTYTVSNTGGVPTTPLSIAVTGDFTLAGTCVAGAVLNNAATCTVIVVHAPTSVGSDMGILTISAATGGMLTSTVSSNGISGLTLTGGVPAFGTTAVLGAGIQRVFTFTNAAGSPTTDVLDYAVTGANASDFAVVADTCVGLTRAAATACTVTVEFVPSAAGARSATLTVGDGTAEKRAVVAMTGTGM
jgi:hypothetical protein